MRPASAGHAAPYFFFAALFFEEDFALDFFAVVFWEEVFFEEVFVEEDFFAGARSPLSPCPDFTTVFAFRFRSCESERLTSSDSLMRP